MTSETNLDAAKSSGAKKRGKLRWVWLFLAMLAAMTITVVSCCSYSLRQSFKILVASRYVESWSEGVDGESLLNVSYGDKEWNKLHMFFPKDLAPEKSHAAFVFIHGGAWIGGSFNNMRSFAQRMTKAGYVSASIEYMLYKQGVTDSIYSVAAIMDEIDAALVKIKETAAERGIQLDRVALGGDSAGGHLLSLYAYSRGKTAPIPVVFIAPRVAPIDFHLDAWDPVQKPETLLLLVNGMNHVNSVTAEQMKSPDEKTEALIDAISPIAYLTPDNTIPTVSAYGGKDPLVGTKHCAKLVAKFKELGAKSFNDVAPDDTTSIVFDYVEYPNSGHMLEHDPECAEQFEDLVMKYAERYLDSHETAAESTATTETTETTAP